MAEQTTTTKQAAVWNPLRLRALGLGADTESGSRGEQGDQKIGNFLAAPVLCHKKLRYRMPTSSEPSSARPDC